MGTGVRGGVSGCCSALTDVTDGLCKHFEFRGQGGRASGTSILSRGLIIFFWTSTKLRPFVDIGAGGRSRFRVCKRIPPVTPQTDPLAPLSNATAAYHRSTLGPPPSTGSGMFDDRHPTEAHGCVRPRVLSKVADKEWEGSRPDPRGLKKRVREGPRRSRGRPPCRHHFPVHRSMASANRRRFPWVRPPIPRPPALAPSPPLRLRI